MSTSETPEASDAPFTWSEVEAILAAAGGGARPGGLTGLTLTELLALKLYGMPLIAPAAASCCGGGEVGGRGARSALVRGLRGLPPFDGSQFVRLPWGGKPVADADIDRIESWIDDGCPARWSDRPRLPAKSASPPRRGSR
jgi:tyrosinase